MPYLAADTAYWGRTLAILALVPPLPVAILVVPLILAALVVPCLAGLASYLPAFLVACLVVAHKLGPDKFMAALLI